MILDGSELSKKIKDDLKIKIDKLDTKPGLGIILIGDNIESKIFEFNENVLEFISSANLCITRSGASTLSELIFLNVPFLAIPYPFAKDDHQYENALFYRNKNCCWLLNKYEVNKETIINNVISIIENKDDYLFKKENMKKFSYQNEWNKISQILINTINEN